MKVSNSTSEVEELLKRVPSSKKEFLVGVQKELDDAMALTVDIEVPDAILDRVRADRDPNKSQYGD